MRVSLVKLSVSAALLGVTGCGIFGGDSGPVAYPTAPPAVKSPATMPMTALPSTTTSVVRVPVDAIELSHGDYPPPSFPAPTKPGLVEVVDLNGDPTVAVASTSVTGTGGDATKQMSITDITNMSVSLDRTHKYKIVFVPFKPGTSTP